MNGAQCRVARVLLSITKSELAALTGLALKTITRIEADDPSALKAASRARAALVVRGAEFIDEPSGYGVRLRPSLADHGLLENMTGHSLQVKPLIEVDEAGADRVDPAQSRAGRGFLDWTREQAVPALGVGLSTLQDFENGKRLPSDEVTLRIVAGFRAAGVTFSRSNVHFSVHLAAEQTN